MENHANVLALGQYDVGNFNLNKYFSYIQYILYQYLSSLWLLKILQCKVAIRNHWFSFVLYMWMQFWLCFYFLSLKLKRLYATGARLLQITLKPCWTKIDSVCFLGLADLYINVSSKLFTFYTCHNPYPTQNHTQPYPSHCPPALTYIIPTLSVQYNQMLTRVTWLF